MWTDAPLAFPEAHSNNSARPPVDLQGALGFGRLLAPFAVTAEYHADSGWGPLTIVDRAAAKTMGLAGAIQYGLTVFEGLKAYRAVDATVHLFRPEAHAARFRASAQRLCLPELATGDFLSAVAATVRANGAWVPPHGPAALYLRPTLLGVDETMGFRSARQARLFIAASPSSPTDDHPLTLWAEQEFCRAADGGLGAVKTGANYAASLLATQRAQRKGYDQVLWLDARERRYVTEGGTMNLFAVLAGRVVTPPLDGTILAGITRDTCIQLLRDHGIDVEERPVALDELESAAATGTLEEVWCSGTAVRLGFVRSVGTCRGEFHPVGGELGVRLRGWLAEVQEGRGARATHPFRSTVVI